MSQQYINVGAVANDGTGQSLRTAFEAVNNNFSNIWAQGPVDSQVVITNNVISTNVSNSPLVLRANGIAEITVTSSVAPSIDSVFDLGSSSNQFDTVWSRYYVGQDGTFSRNLTVGGNLVVTGNVIEMGNIVTDSLTIQLANTASTANAANGAGITVGSNDNIATFLYNSSNNVWATNIGLQVNGSITGTSIAVSDATVYGNIAAVNGNFTSNVGANYFIGNGSQLTGLPAGYANANAVSYGESGWAGNIIPSGNSVYSLGSPTHQWNDLYVSNATIYMNNVPISLTSGNVLTVNGDDVVTTNANGQTTLGNLSVDDYNIYNANGQGVIISNFSFVAEEETAYVQIPAGNSTQDLNVVQEQGNVRLVANAAVWTFGSNGNLTFPDNSGSGWPINQQRFGMGNVGAWLDGGWTIGEFSGNGVSGQVGIRIDPGVEGNTGINLPSQADSVTQPTQIYNTGGGGITLFTDYAGNTWTFGADGNLTVPGSIIGQGNLYLAPDANNLSGRLDIFLTTGPDIHIAGVGENLIMGRDDTANVTIGVDGNVYVQANTGTAYTWQFGGDSHLIVPGNIQSINTGFPFTSTIIDMTAGSSTVVVSIADNPFPDPVSGQVVISGVTGATEANNTWWYQAVETNAFQLYTDSTLSTPVDGSTWSAYVSGGLAVCAGYNNLAVRGGNVTLETGTQSWTFNDLGGVVFPTLTVNLHNGGNQSAQTLQFGDPNRQAVITGPTPPSGSSAQRLIIQGQNGGTGEGGDVYLWAGDSNVNGGDIKIYAGDADVSGYGGYINIDGGSGVDGGGQLTLTGGYSSGGQGGQITITPGYSGNANGSALTLNGGQGAGDGGPVNITAGYGGANGGQVTITGGQSALGLPGYGNVVVQAGVSSWSFDNTGVLTVPGEGIIQSLNDTVVLQSKNTTSGNIVTARFGTNGGLYFEGTEYPQGWLNLTNSSGDANISSPSGSLNIDAANGTSGAAGKDINITAGDADQTDYYTTAGGDVNIQGGMGAFNDGGGGGPGGNVNLVAGTSADPAGNAGNVTITSGTWNWQFYNNGNLYVPGQINGDNNGNLIIDGAGYGNGYISLPAGSFGGEQVVIVNDFSLGNGIALTTTGGTWHFDNAGDLSANGNITGNYFIGNGSQLTGLPASYSNANVATFLAAYGSNTVSTTGNIAAGNFIGSGSNVDIVAGTYDWTFDSTGNLTLPGNTFSVNYANGTQVSLGGGSSYGNANVAANLAAFGSNPISTTGNITAGNVSLNGNLTVNGSPIYGAPASYAKYVRTATQTGMASNSVVVCNVLENAFGSDISVDTSTGNVTLQANNTYRVRGTVGSMVNNGNPVSGAWQWRNVTGNAYIGTSGSTIAPAASNYNTGASQIAEAVFTPSVTTVLQLTVTTISNGSVISTPASTNEGGAAWIDVEVIGGQAPITAFSTAGNVTGGNVLTAGIVSATGNITGGNLITTGAFTSASVSSTGNIVSGNGFHLILGNATSALRQNSSNANVQLSGSVTLNPDTAASALNGVLIGGSGYILGPGGSRNITLNYSTNGGMGAQSNVNAGVGGSGGSFIAPGTLTTGINGLLVGPTFTPLSNTSAGFVANVNNYTQVTFQNKSTGADATADYILTADNGSDTVNYGDFGIINSGYDNSTPTNSLGNIVFAADTYLYAQGNTGNASQSGGNLAIGTTVPGKTVKIFAGGVTNSSIIANISNTGVSVTGNVTASNFIGNISITGNVQGTSPNVSLVAGSYTYTFDNAGTMTLPAGSGAGGANEGGQINFNLGANATINGPVAIDMYTNQMRFFETAGNNRGAYIDFTQAATSVGTLLNNRVGTANLALNTSLTFDNLAVQIRTQSSGVWIFLATVSGSATYQYAITYQLSGGGAAQGTTGTMSATTTPATVGSAAWFFSTAASQATVTISDTTNNKMYRATWQTTTGSSPYGNFVSIERLV